MRITSSPADVKGGKGEVTGTFDHWVGAGSWSDKPTGPLYLETAVLTRMT